MSDFMKWLYPRYIRPYLDAVPQADYSFHFELVENELGQHAVESYEKGAGVYCHPRLFAGAAHRRGAGRISPP
ncbi:MAG: hypothetical protein V8R75_12170 [Oscillospiraceae bacterium]